VIPSGVPAPVSAPDAAAGCRAFAPAAGVAVAAFAASAAPSGRWHVAAPAFAVVEFVAARPSGAPGPAACGGSRSAADASVRDSRWHSN